MDDLKLYSGTKVGVEDPDAMIVVCMPCVVCGLDVLVGEIRATLDGIDTDRLPIAARHAKCRT